MRYIDEKFKDNDPVKTVELIKNILKDENVDVEEQWFDSGLDNCFSLYVYTKNIIMSSNGKGVSKELARASAYAEFVERLQCGLMLHKYQSIVRQEGMNIHAFAPDVKYMTTKELAENGEWMDYIIKGHNFPHLTREGIAQKCKIFACTDDDKILTLPFYSLFEKKYVYLPMDFIDYVYGTNGCCAGNTKEEAWVHAFSEILERHAALKYLKEGISAPKIPEEEIKKCKVAYKIIQDVRSYGIYEIDVFDLSDGIGYPVVSTRIINKKTHKYHVNVAADPVFEIALQRTLTETFQGRSVTAFDTRHKGQIMNKPSDYPVGSNVRNQLETGSGLFTADYFADEITCDRGPSKFEDNSNKTNKELLQFALEIMKKLNKPVYVRNFSYLGFPSYIFIIPGFSEALVEQLAETVPEYAILDKVSKTLRNPCMATDSELNWLLTSSQMLSPTIGKYMNFSKISGALISSEKNYFLAGATRAYAAYKLGKYKETLKYISEFIGSIADETQKEYFECVRQYVELKAIGIDDIKIKSILRKFHMAQAFERLYNNLENGKTPFDDVLLKCDFKNCEDCIYKEYCDFKGVREINKRIGKKYKEFVHGQAESEFFI